MFSGIVEALGVVEKVESEGSNKSFVIASPISKDTYIDQSISHNGVCLTVVAKTDHTHTVTAVEETLLKSNLNAIKNGDKVNLERCITLESRLDGHMVQGHVDSTMSCTKKEERDGSWLFTFAYDKSYEALVVDKGSICINGVSLTLIDPSNGTLTVTIIPYTYEHTNFLQLHVGDQVNVEFDIVGKYVQKYLSSIQFSG